MGLILPALICGLGWRDWAGGIVYAGLIRVFFFQQGVFPSQVQKVLALQI